MTLLPIALSRTELHGAQLDIAHFGAVIVTTAGWHEAIALRQLHESGPGLRRMIRVIDLDALKAGGEACK